MHWGYWLCLCRISYGALTVWAMCIYSSIAIDYFPASQHFFEKAGRSLRSDKLEISLSDFNHSTAHCPLGREIEDNLVSDFYVFPEQVQLAGHGQLRIASARNSGR
jgi:hypothetical protein